MSYQPQSSQPGAFLPQQQQPPPPMKKSNKALWIVLGLIIGVPTVLMGGCIALFVLAGASASRQQQQQAAAAKPAAASPASAPSAPSAPAAPASPATGVTMANYNRIKNGMTYSQVVGILGKSGTELSSNDIAGYQSVMYQWDGDSWGANMNAMFQNGKLIQKAQFGLK